MKFFLSGMAVIFLSSCAIGPLMSHETARTLGRGHHEFMGGVGQAGASFKWNFGVTENLDLGLQQESFSFGGRAKYAFLNEKERGFSLAAALGVGGNMGGSHRYADLLFSYLAGSWEPYGTVRAVHVKVDATDFKDKDTGRVVFKVPEDEFSYGEGMLGVRYWITPRWSLNAEAGKIFPISSNLEIDGGVFAGAALGYRF